MKKTIFKGILVVSLLAILSPLSLSAAIDCQALYDSYRSAYWAYKDAQTAGKTWAEMAPLQATYSDLKARWSDDYYRQTCQSVKVTPYYRDVQGK